MPPGTGAVLFGSDVMDIQRARARPDHSDVRRLLGEDRRRRELCSADSGKSPARRKRSATLRWDHALLASEALEGRPWEEGRRCGTRRAWAHGGEACPCHGNGSYRAEPVAP